MGSLHEIRGDQSEQLSINIQESNQGPFIDTSLPPAHDVPGLWRLPVCTSDSTFNDSAYPATRPLTSEREDDNETDATHATTQPLTPAWNDDEKEARAVTQPLHPLLTEHPPYDIPETRFQEQTPPTEPADPDDDTQVLDPAQLPSLILHRSIQGLAFAARRDVGRMRQMNQDSVFGMLMSLPREASDVPLGLFIVADGMGGHASGEVASRLAMRTVLHEVLAQLVLPALDDDVIEALQPLMIGAVQEANRTIWDQARIAGSDMGTTCTAALLLGQAIYIAHVGDSRAYLCEAGGLRLLTSDHSTVGRLIQMGRLSPEEARTHPLRNQLYRTIGQQPEVQVDFVYQPIGNSSHLLLCSDGLWGMVPEDQLEHALLHSPWPQDACEELIALANLAGGEDNISAVVVTLPIGERLHT